MKLFAKWILKLYIVLLLLVVGTLLIGHQQVGIPVALHLDICTLPCWINIIPGKSTVNDAKEHIRLVYGKSSQYRVVEGNSWVDIFDVTNGTLIAKVVFLVPKLNISNDDIIKGIEIQSNVLIGDTMLALSTPDSISLWGKGGGTFPALLYAVYGVIVTVDTPTFDPKTCTRIAADEHVQSLTIYPNLPKEDIWGGYIPQKWIIAGYCYKWLPISDQ